MIRRYKRFLINATYHSGLVNTIAGRLTRHCLTVVTYHRVTEYPNPTFDGYEPNISATPAAFTEQMDYLKTRFNIISLTELLAWFHNGSALPPNPALVTFDDGYRDNYEFAFPILKKRSIPAVIFLATDYINQCKPFYWDVAAYCFQHSQQKSANLPFLGQRTWSDAGTRGVVLKDWLTNLKQIPDTKKQDAITRLPGILNVTLPNDCTANHCLSWDQVRAMLNDGIEFGSHSQSHPIMTQIPLPQAYNEIAGAKTKIEEETGRPVQSFAYPNGGSHDFSDSLHAMVQTTGISLGFTLMPAPMQLNKIHSSPIAIRRALIHKHDSLERFAAKLIGFGRIVKSIS